MIRLEGVTKIYAGAVPAVRDLDLEVAAGEVCILVGPSGCGKTTTMKMINRLIEPTEGRILIDGRDVLGMDPYELRRDLGYVIQHVGLFPHFTVRDNIATVPELKGWPRERVRARVDELLQLAGLDPDAFRDRYPSELSGGQQQRIGVARAMAADPPVMLMDEPFGALDPITRARLQNEFLRIQARIKKTIVFVTHDIDEAIKMGDRIAVMRGGRLVQYATPSELLGRPADEFVADLVGTDRAVKRLILVRAGEAMEHLAATVREDEGVERARALMAETERDWLPVVDAAGRAVGEATQEDLDGADGAVGQHCHPLPTRVEVDTTLRDTLSEMLSAGTGRVLVVGDDQRPEGFVSMGTLLGAMGRREASPRGAQS